MKPPTGAVALRAHLGTLAGAAILGVLLWRLGTGVFLDGLRRADTPALLAALGLGLLTTVFSAWRWCLVARGLGIRLPLGTAVADYYRALFLNAALPGGVLGDVHRAVRHGQSTGDVGRGVRAVVLERTAGQVVLAVVGVTILLTRPSPVLTRTRHAVLLLAVVSVCAAVTAGATRRLRTSRTPVAPGSPGEPRTAPRGGAVRAGRAARAVRALLTEARGVLLARGSWPGVLLSSLVVLAGHVAMFLLAARAAGSAASPAELTPLALLALIAMGLPLNVGGWGPREGVTAWAFGAAGLGAGMGLTVAVVYGVLSLAACLPGAAVLIVRWYAGLRPPRAERAGASAVTDTGPSPVPASVPASVPVPEPESVPVLGAVPVSEGGEPRFSRSPPPRRLTPTRTVSPLTPPLVPVTSCQE
ncbi:lysylphosphatidylglycerol synthase transmembrane domain-containing protein [Streptomyces sp. NPDC008313]|uniref:lysylphosphatidylglycerol synthase transmembrane domain-containing protein n=1 Tax=Streptomyces sp. NPDC008313 TaxID=3364826 RepID=UPI0036E79B49